MRGNIAPATRLTVLKHLVAGKDAEMVAVIVKLSRYEVIDLASNHGYPDVAKMAQAVETIARNIENSDREAIAGQPRRASVSIPTPRRPVEATHPRPAAAVAEPAPSGNGRSQIHTQSAELRDVISAGKASKSKRTQALATRIVADVARLEAAIHAEQAKVEAARRKAEQKAAEVRARSAERAALQKKRAELEAELASVKAKLRGRTSTAADSVAPAAVGQRGEIPAKEIRAWAREAGIDVPAAGRVPEKVRKAYAAAHPAEQAA